MTTRPRAGMTERAIQNAIIRAFGTRQDLRVWRANTGAARYGNRAVTFGVPGQADLTGVLPLCGACPECGAIGDSLGVRLEIEVKSRDGRQSVDQANYQRIIERFGGIYILARSPADVWRAIERYGYQPEGVE